MNVLNTSSSSSEDELQVVVRRRKVYRKRRDCFTKYNDNEFFDRFRLTKVTVLSLLEQIEERISPATNRGGSISAMIQLLLTLRFFATGNMLISVADFIGISKASTSRIVRRVSNVVASLAREYIKMPANNEEMERAAETFYEIARFPRVIGAIDCTLIKIQSPGGDDAEIFRCRKGFFAFNVQTVADASLRIKNIVVRWPGSCHDETIFNNSRLRQDFETGRYGRYLMVGDSGYRIEPYLMIPLQQTATPAENLYNESQIRTRNVVERQYGVWKRRFPILSLGIKVKLSTAMDIIVATAVLHNIALAMNEEVPNNWLQDDLNGQEEHNDQPVNHVVNQGRDVRRLLINEHFAQL